jgi:hypothetical protein
MGDLNDRGGGKSMPRERYLGPHSGNTTDENGNIEFMCGI